MFYKAVGVEGENIDYSHEMPIYEIILKDRVVNLPFFYHLCWLAFLEGGGEYGDVVRQQFIDDLGLTENDYEDTMKILLDEGVIVTAENS